MQIIPAIDIKNGKCVRLYQGDYAKLTVYDDDPVSVALKWEKYGATMLHIVDLDGAKEGSPQALEIIKRIINSVKIPVETGGGYRDVKAVQNVLETGVSKVVLGTVAVENTNMIKQLIDLYGERIMVSLDAKNGKLMKKGWVEQSDMELIPTVKQLESMGVQTIVYTDTTRDGTMTEPNYAVIKTLRERTKITLFVAGGISTINQVMKLNDMKVDGVIIGKALYEGNINIKEVIQYVN